MPTKKTTFTFAELGLGPEAVARLKKGDLGALGAGQRLILSQALPDPEAKPAPVSVPLAELERKFFQWLDDSAAGAPLSKIKAFHVCLYEGIDCFEADFFGCPTYSKTDPDWACEWCYEGKGRFAFASDDIEPEWETGLRIAKRLLKSTWRALAPGPR